MSNDDDDGWFSGVVREHRAVLRNYVARRVQAQDVDDVVAEVLTAAWRHRDRRPPEPRLWLLRAAQHTVLHQYRAQRRRQRLDLRLGQQRPTPIDPGAGANDSDAAHAVRECLVRLGDADQELLRLVYWEQLSLDEVAYVVGASAVATRVRLHRARRRLAVLLPDWVGGCPAIPDERQTVTSTPLRHTVPGAQE